MLRGVEGPRDAVHVFEIPIRHLLLRVIIVFDKKHGIGISGEQVPVEVYYRKVQGLDFPPRLEPLENYSLSDGLFDELAVHQAAISHLVNEISGNIDYLVSLR